LFAVLIAGKLIDGKLWDGASPICINHVYAMLKKIKHLSEREMSLFTLDDFVSLNGNNEIDSEPNDELLKAEHEIKVRKPDDYLGLSPIASRRFFASA
jgi:hypothetical protein